MRTAIILLGALLANPALSPALEVESDAESAARIYDQSCVRALMFHGACTIALKVSSFSYNPPLDCVAVCSRTAGKKIENLSPEAVLSHGLKARIDGPFDDLASMYDAESQPLAKEQYAKVFRLPQGARVSISGGTIIGDTISIVYTIEGLADGKVLTWFEVLHKTAFGWKARLPTISLDPLSYLISGYVTDRRSLGFTQHGEESALTFFKLVWKPVLHPEAISNDDLAALKVGEAAIGIKLDVPQKPEPLDSPSSNGDPGLQFLASAMQQYRKSSDIESIRTLWGNPHPALLPDPPFGWRDENGGLRFCHATIHGDAFSVYLLGNGKSVVDAAVVGLKNKDLKLENVPLIDNSDGGLMDVVKGSHIWTDMAVTAVH